MLTKQEIRQLGDKALNEEIASARNDLLKIKFAVRNGTSKESNLVKNLKKYVAQLKTLKRELTTKKVEKKDEPTELKIKKTSTKGKKKTTNI